MIYKSKAIWFHTGPPLSVYPMILLLMRIFLRQISTASHNSSQHVYFEAGVALHTGKQKMAEALNFRHFRLSILIIVHQTAQNLYDVPHICKQDG